MVETERQGNSNSSDCIWEAGTLTRSWEPRPGMQSGQETGAGRSVLDGGVGRALALSLAV